MRTILVIIVVLILGGVSWWAMHRMPLSVASTSKLQVVLEPLVLKADPDGVLKAKIVDFKPANSKQFITPEMLNQAHLRWTCEISDSEVRMSPAHGPVINKIYKKEDEAKFPATFEISLREFVGFDGKVLPGKYRVSVYFWNETERFESVPVEITLVP